MLLFDVCLSVAYIGPKSRTERPRKTKIGTEVAEVTRDSDTTFKVKRSRSPGRFTRRHVGALGSCSGGYGNVLAMRNCCYVAVCSAVRGASAPTGEERGGGISWRPPAYSLLLLNRCWVKCAQWKRPPGQPRMTWMKMVQNDLDSHGRSWTDAVDLAQNRPLWRLLATSGAMHS